MVKPWVKVVCWIGMCWALAAMTSGCAWKAGPTVTGSSGDQWTVVESSAGVKPLEGIAEKMMTVDGYRVIDWISEETLLAYQFSATVFGEDRGLVAMNPASGEVLKRYGLMGTYFEGAVSPDRTKLLYSVVSDRRGEGNHLFMLDLGTGETKAFQGTPYDLTNRVRWSEASTGLQTQEKGAVAVELVRLTPERTKRFEAAYPEAWLDEKSYPYPEQFVEVTHGGEAGKGFYGLVNANGKNYAARVVLNASDELASKTLEILPVEGAIGLWPSPPGQSGAEPNLLVLTAGTSYLEKRLVVCDLAGRVLKVLNQAPENIQTAVWINDKELLYSVYDNQKGFQETAIHWLNIETGADHYVTAYTKGLVESLRPSIRGDRILVNLAGNGPVVEGEPVSQIIVLK